PCAPVGPAGPAGPFVAKSANPKANKMNAATAANTKYRISALGISMARRLLGPVSGVLQGASLGAQRPGQVPGSGWSILAEPPLGTRGNVTNSTYGVVPVLTTSSTSPGRSMNACPAV